MALALNVIVIMLEVRGLSLSFPERKWKTLVFYTQISNVIAFISSILFVLLGQLPFVTAVRYLSVCMLIMTFFVTTCVLIPMGGDPKKLLCSGNCLYHHVLCPIISAVSYIIFEGHVISAAIILLPVAVTLVYGIIMLYLNAIERVDGPYPFFRVHNQTVTATILWVIVLLTATCLISWAVWLIAK